MIKYFTLLGLLFLLNIVTKAQNDTEVGMKFEHLPSMQSLFAKAKKENKLVFVDCYTTWCGPCKMMDANVFNKKEVGDFYNANYVSAKIQLDTTDNDDAYVKSWHKEGQNIKQKYKIYSVPTYFIFNGDGEVLHRLVGFTPAERFIDLGKKMLNPDNQYYTQLKKYEAGERSPEFILHLVELSNASGDKPTEKKIIEEYLSTQKNLYTKENLELLYSTVKSSKDKGFEIAYKDGEKADKILGKPGTSNALIFPIILSEEYMPLKKSNKQIDFNKLDAVYKEKYPKYAKFFSDYAKMSDYYKNKDWSKYAEYATEVLKRDDFVPQSVANQIAQNVLAQVSDPKQLEKVLNWVKASKDKEPNAAIVTTYANLLYKLGKKEEAIAEQQNAIEMAKKEKLKIAKYYESILEKMKKGEPID